MNLHRTLGVICLTLLCGLIWGSGATADQGISLDEVKSFHTGYATYYDGPEIAGLPLENINGDATYCCSFMYGTCTPPPPVEGGCAPPLEIQVFSTCERWFRGISGRRHAHVHDFRGAKVITDYPPETYTPEIFTGRTTVVFWGSPKIVKAAERQLREVHQTKPQALPPPVPGSLWGKLPCQRKPG